MADGTIGEVVQPENRGGSSGEGQVAAVVLGPPESGDGAAATVGRPELSGAKRALLEARRRRASQAPIDMPAGGPIVLSSAQERVWVLDQVDGGTAAYNAPRALRIRGALDVGALQRALDEIVRRHEVLRTVIELVDGEPAARLLPAGPVTLRTVDVTGESGAARDAAVRSAVDAEVQRPFDLSRDLLLRALLVRKAPDDHVLAIVSHHIASDDRSKRVVAAELEALYMAFAADEPSPLPDLALQYCQFARWEQSRMTSSAFRSDLDYWKDRLEALPPPIELPTDYSRPGRWSHEGATYISRLDADLTQAVREISRDARATLFMVLEAAFVALINRLSPTDDVVVGTPVSGRSHPELDDLVGYFSNTLVLRHDLTDDPTFATLLQRVRRDVVDAFEHQSVPFERLVEEIGPERDPARHPLFQVMFTLRPGGVSLPRLGGLDVSSFKFRSGTAKFDLSLIAIDEGDGIRLAWEYSTRLFTEDGISRMAERFATLLAAGVAQPSVPVSDLDVIGPRERDELLGWGTTERRTVSDLTRTLVSRFRATVAAHGDRVAVRDPDGRALTFYELDAASARLARHLISSGVAPGDRVGILLERSVDLVVALVAVQRAGAAYVPLEPDYPAERVAYVLADSEVTALVSRSRLLAGSGGYAGPVVDLDADRAAIEACDPTELDVSVAPDDVAYVIYTSGSTGRPKGVVVPHRGVENTLAEMAERPGLVPGEVMVGLTTPAFDLSVPDLFLPLLTGATLVLAAVEVARDPVILAHLLDEVGADLVQATPSTWRMLCESGWTGRPSLRIVCGGEGYGPELVEALVTRVSEVWNFYGPTEASVWAVRRRLTEHDAGPVPMGRPIPGMSCAVVDDRGRRVPVGVAGELWLAGDGLAIGYLGREDLTSDRFVERELDTSRRWYRTGDIVRYRADGSLLFVGRSDHQVKLRGFRVELGEIESALLAQEGVTESVVVVREDREGDQRLVAYLVGDNMDTDHVRAGVRAMLPTYMVPSAFVVLDRLPLTSNGKLDRGALPEPGGPVAWKTSGRVPTTPTEVQLAQLWATVLDVHDCRADDNFFDEGGHSLHAVRLTALIDSELGVTLPVLAVFEHPVLGELAAQIDVARSGPQASRPVPIDRRGHAIGVHDLDNAVALAAAAAGAGTSDVDEEIVWVFPMSFAQERMWILQALEPDRGTYNMPSYRHVDGPLDVRALEEAFATVAERHDILRTTYLQRDDVLVQVVHPSGRIPVVVDARPAASLEEAVERVRQEVLRPLDLVRGPLTTVRVVPLEDKTSLVTTVVHHIATDGWSLDLLLSELDSAYTAHAAGASPDLPPAPLQFADVAHWHREWLDDERIDELCRYWREELSGLPSALEPTHGGGAGAILSEGACASSSTTASGARSGSCAADTGPHPSRFSSPPWAHSSISVQGATRWPSECPSRDATIPTSPVYWACS